MSSVMMRALYVWGEAPERNRIYKERAELEVNKIIAWRIQNVGGAR